MKHMLTKKICSIYTRWQQQKKQFAYLSNINDATFPTLSIYRLIYTKSSSWKTLLLYFL